MSKYGKCLRKNIPISSLNHPEKYEDKSGLGVIEIRSSWELRFLKYLDSNPNIVKWGSEETIIQYKNKLDGRMHRYFVDFHMDFINKKGEIRKALIEIKPYDQTIKPNIKASMKANTKQYLTEQWITNQSKWDAAREYCKKRNWLFLIITEKDLRLNR